MALTKKAFRQLQIPRMAEFAKTPAFTKESHRLQDQLLAYLTRHPQGSVGLTMSGGIEVPTEPLLTALLAAGRPVLLPKTFSDRTMHFVPYHGQAAELARTDYGILEPVADADEVPAIVVVPGIAFVRGSHARVGFGAGYYDRYLAARGSAIRHTVTMATSVMLFNAPTWRVAAHDVAVDTLLEGKQPNER
ncbi:5-formyltetrahydrofolate cyclo-ligase [Schleiferilactobacillus shenzhenensis]|nr:5-formyltetrahydrofolate cyclo-ligase [Schleiferilactobacillus shenzhenensis]